MFPCLNHFLYTADRGYKVFQNTNYHTSCCISEDHSLSHICSPHFHHIAGPVLSLIMAVFLYINIVFVRLIVLTMVTTNVTALVVGITSLKMATVWIFMFVFSTSDPMFPALLAHYGPWGYLMLGMLICGAILMLCGLRECCCRSSKHQLPAGGPASTSAATTVFIISSAGRMGRHRRNSTIHQDEAPPTPGPPLIWGTWPTSSLQLSVSSDKGN